MASAAEIQNAEKIYNSICSMLDGINFRYEKEKRDDDYIIRCTVNGDDIPMDMIIFVRAEREIVSLLSPMPFKAPEDKRVETAIAVSVANYGMIDGCFDYDINDGEIRFRMTASFIDSQVGEEQFKYMLFVSAQTIDRYNDRFMALVKGTMTLQQFLANRCCPLAVHRIAEA